MFFKALGKYLKVIVAVATTYFTAGLASGWATSWVISAGMTTSVTMAGAIASGTLKGALSGAFSGAVFGAIDGSFKEYCIENTGTQIAVHAAAGGIISDVQGSNFGHGFVTAGIMKGKVNTNNSPSRVILQALARGTV